MRGKPEINNKANVTLSVDNDVLQEIKNESERLGTSINSRVSRILEEHTLFGKYFAEHRPIIIAPDLFKLLLQDIKDDTLRESWKIAASQITPQIFMMHNIPNTLENFVHYSFDEIATRVGAFESCTVTSDKQGNITITARHNYGLKWSKAVAHAYAEFIQTNFKSDVSLDLTSDFVKMKIMKNHQ